MTPSEHYHQLRQTPIWHEMKTYYGLGPWNPKRGLSDMHLAIRVLLKCHEEYWFGHEVMKQEQKKHNNEAKALLNEIMASNTKSL